MGHPAAALRIPPSLQPKVPDPFERFRLPAPPNVPADKAGLSQTQAGAALTSTEKVLYAFESVSPQGSAPQAGVIGDEDGNLYGTTSSGGLGSGLVYKVSPSGQQTVLYEFTGGADGSQPYAGVVRDAAGDLYGTTFSGGGVNNCGVVFKLEASGKETVLHAFTCGTDGGGPEAAVTLDPNGNLYGTTAYGGNISTCTSFILGAGCGVVFKLDPAGNETVLYAFSSGFSLLYGRPEPAGSLTLDRAGNVYGTIAHGGNSTACAYGCGVVFKVDKSGKESALYTFMGGTDGAYPIGGVVIDQTGTLYGTAYLGGNSSQCYGGCGVVFKVDPSGKESVLYSFADGTDGAYPWAGLIRDAAGNLFGTANVGGDVSCGCGVVFKLDTSGKETVLYTFLGQSDGGYPMSGVIRDEEGKLYGTTTNGGLLKFGTVYELDGTSIETAYAFPSSHGGSAPYTGLVGDPAGNLYGTTSYGGKYNQGVVYKLDPSGRETLLHAFTGAADGSYPGTLTIDSVGNLYGGTALGGVDNSGVVFKMDSSGNETVLHTFTGGADGLGSGGSLARDRAGNLYGTSSGGNLSLCGGNGCGLVFKLDRYGNETVLYTFSGGADGGYPNGSLVLDSAGDLYGTTSVGGNSSANFGEGAGVVFELNPSGSETVLYTFSGGADGEEPAAGVIRDSAGNLYGTTQYGGNTTTCFDGCGVVFKLDPSGNETVLHAFTGGADGASPYLGSLLRDRMGNLFGTTSGGGSGWGLVFKLDSSANETVLYTFTGGTDGGGPFAGVISDSAGNLYGTTPYEGKNAGGVVFKVPSH